MGDAIARAMAAQAMRRIDDMAVYGAFWDKSSTPTLTRMGVATDMAANAGVDGQAAQNDFDSTGIYRNITEVADAYGNKFVRIPKMYICKTDSANLKTWQVSKVKHDSTWYLPWCFWDFANQRELPYVDVGKYIASLSADSKLESKSGKAPLVSKNIVDFRTHATSNNTGGLQGYQLLDIHAVDMLQTLFYVEFATLHSQEIMYGYANRNSAVAVSGLTDGVVASSGSPDSNSDGKHTCKYRGIENLWGNVYQFVDGVNINDYQAWVCKDAAVYESNVFASPYEKLSYINKNTGNWVTAMGRDPGRPFAELPTATGSGSESTYYADYYYPGAGQKIALLGGNWSDGSNAGLSFWGLFNSSSDADSSIGGRLLKKPL